MNSWIALSVRVGAGSFGFSAIHEDHLGWISLLTVAMGGVISCMLEWLLSGRMSSSSSFE